MKTVSALHGPDTSMDGDDISFGFQQIWLTVGGRYEMKRVLWKLPG